MTLEPGSHQPGGEEGGLSAVVFRAATAADVWSVAAIEAQSFSNPWQPDTFRSLISRNGAYIPVAEAPDGSLVGYAVFWWAADQGELANLAVLESYQRRGIGSALLNLVMDRAREEGLVKLFLEVRRSNERALELYRSRGFTQIGVRKGYYRRPLEDALIFQRPIS
jgi:ribosomal-protein-alanine N-acetyltransferase